jgi:transposase InsO family protein
MELRMSRKERDRLKVIEPLNQGLIGQRQAAGWLDLSVRQVRRLLRRYQAHGDGGLVHQGRGKPSNRCLDEAIVARAKELLRTRYRGFGPTLAAEHLAEDDAVAVSREAVRGWMTEQGLWGGQRKKRPHRHRRPRRACFGELVQIDTSSHDWLEGRGEPCVLITMIDDATGRKLARFFDTDSTATNMALIKLWIERHGRPLAIYSDWASHFKQTPKRGHKAAAPPTQIQRALGELDIVLIAAHSPQAKGRVERSHGTDQDRLVKEMRLAGISTRAAANRFLEEVYLARVEAKFAVAPASKVDAHRDAQGYDLEAIFSVQEERRVANDYTVSVDGVAWQIERGEISGGLRRSKVTVERRPDGTMRLRWGDRYLKYNQAPVDCKIDAEGAGTPPGAAAGWPGASLREDSLRSPCLHCAPGHPANPQDQPEVKPNPKYKPSPDHPWRKRTLLLCRK